MNNNQLPDENEMFMAQFTNRLNLEPTPQWARQKKFAIPWLEIGWAAVAAVMLALYWTPLRFGFFSLHAVVSQQFAHLPLSWLCVGLASAYWLFTLLTPNIEEIY